MKKQKYVYILSVHFLMNIGKLDDGEKCWEGVYQQQEKNRLNKNFKTQRLSDCIKKINPGVACLQVT